MHNIIAIIILAIITATSALAAEPINPLTGEPMKQQPIVTSKTEAKTNNPTIPTMPNMPNMPVPYVPAPMIQQGMSSQNMNPMQPQQDKDKEPKKKEIKPEERFVID